MKLNPSVGQSGDTGEGKTGDCGVATELEDDELSGAELKDDVKVELNSGGEPKEALGHELDPMP